MQHLGMETQTITAEHWQIAIGKNGDIVTDVKDIEQCIQVILRTPKGCDPHRPEFGSNLSLYIDQPLPQVIPHIITEAKEAIYLWEPRTQVISAMPIFGEYGQLIMVVKWQPTADATKTFESKVEITK